MAKKTLFQRAKTNKVSKSAEITTTETVVYDFEVEKEECIKALVTLVGEQQAAEGLHFIRTQCENDPAFVQMIFDREKRNSLVGIMSNLNPAEMLGNMFSKIF